jgi:hypothetical protein
VVSLGNSGELVPGLAVNLGAFSNIRDELWDLHNGPLVSLDTGLQKIEVETN